MAYTKKTWVNGETIYASGMNNMEDGIADADAAASNSVHFNEVQSLTDSQKDQARSNIGALKASVANNTLILE